MVAAVAAAVVAWLAVAGRPLAAQQAVSALPQWEARLTGAAWPDVGALAGLGVNVRAGWYARVGVALTAGAVLVGDRWDARQRVDATARFMFDPFGERDRGLYAGAGLGAERGGDGSARGLLLGVVGVEGKPAGRVVPALELTLGGGVRVGVVLRGRRPQGR
jgi:hypothetical protein